MRKTKVKEVDFDRVKLSEDLPDKFDHDYYNCAGRPQKSRHGSYVESNRSGISGNVHACVNNLSIPKAPGTSAWHTG